MVLVLLRQSLVVVVAGISSAKPLRVLSTVFFVTSISLAVVAKNKTVVDSELLPELEAIPFEALQESDVPAVNDSAEETSEVPQ